MSKFNITSQDLKDGKSFTFSTEEDALEIWFKADNKNNWIHPFQGMFNAEFFSYKTFNGFKLHCEKLIEKYNLTLEEDEENN